MQTEISDKLPACIGFIMDGNRRWAAQHGHSSLEGHRAGKEKFEEVIEWIKEKKIPYGIFYAFSTENWKRPKEEISYLMQSLEGVLEHELDTLRQKNIKLRFIGQRDRFSEKLRELMHICEEETKENTGPTIALALSYGGRTEIITAANKAIADGKTISEEDFDDLLWTTGIPDPDVIIRTGGEHRLSNFLPWQSIYSELFFINTFWPAFSRAEFDTILSQFASRERRMGT